MRTHKCEECGAVLDPAKILRCTKCKACCYCSRACQKRNWKGIHKRVCSTDPALRPFVPVEMAVERVLAKLPPMEQAPKDATCYICLEGDGGKSSKLMRGCACRGDSAGFVHIKCLTELAMSKDGCDDTNAVFDGWNTCGNCKQRFEGALGLEMRRRFWRLHRSNQEVGRRYGSTRALANYLGYNGEVDAATQLLDAASTCIGNNSGMLLDLKLCRADLLIKNGEKIEGLGLLQALLPEVRVYTARPHLYGKLMQDMTTVLLGLDRYQEAHEAAAELVAFAKANCGLEDAKTLIAVEMYAVACAKLGRVEEAKAKFEEALTTQIRVLGPEHHDTQVTLRSMRTYGIAGPSG